MKHRNEMKIVISEMPEKPKEQRPTPGELFCSVIGWIIAAVLVIIVPTAILCGEPAKVIGIAAAVLVMAAIFTFVACTGWRD